MLLHDSRRDARVDADGDLVLLEDQDRSLWDRDADRRGRGAARARAAPAAGRARTSCRPRSPRCTPGGAAGRDRLARRSPRSTTSCSRAHPVAGGRAEPRRRRRDGRRARSAGSALIDEVDGELDRLPPAARRPRRPAAPPGPQRKYSVNTVVRSSLSRARWSAPSWKGAWRVSQSCYKVRFFAILSGAAATPDFRGIGTGSGRSPGH